MPNTTSTSTMTTTTTVTTTTTIETTKRINTRIAISCSASNTDDELVCSYGDPRVKVDRGGWSLEIAENESVVFVLQNSDDNDVHYTFEAKSSQDGDDWIVWEASDQGVQSPSFSAPTRVEIEMLGLAPGQARAKKSTSGGSITLFGRPDPTLDA